jgi:hypothetical protein
MSAINYKERTAKGNGKRKDEREVFKNPGVEVINTWYGNKLL